MHQEACVDIKSISSQFLFVYSDDADRLSELAPSALQGPCSEWQLWALGLQITTICIHRIRFFQTSQEMCWHLLSFELKAF